MSDGSRAMVKQRERGEEGTIEGVGTDEALLFPFADAAEPDYRLTILSGQVTTTGDWSIKLGGSELTGNVVSVESGILLLGSSTGPTIEMQLEARVSRLERAFEEMKMRLGAEEQREVVVVRELEDEAAKEEIRALLAGGETLYISEIAERLRLPDPQVVDLCAELMAEGDIEVNANA